ncbi:hypothetical protein B0T10DRAFT_15626 [Thelonectria olida]|uniref:Uncharacterized protein n=1 Tax=Thelonectria olida TaxID=1576542 RepID=A0A9P8WKD8_9HYPO|nr:hypothetical protein B0T10DRAFT_15626 [Thelonectria olida]
MKASITYAAVAALAGVSNARNLIRSAPEPTHSFELPSDGVSPRPTEAVMELFRRADELTTLWAPDNTCGYISGLRGAAYTCNGDYQCAFETASSAGNVGCCSAGVCNMRYKCINYEEYYSSSACVDGCVVDADTLKCTATSAPYCNTISFAGGITDYWCNNVEINTAQKASTTYSGGDEREYTTADVTTSVATSELSSASVAQPTVTVHASSSASSSAAADENSDDGDDKSSSNTGAIVGGVVGGVAFLALIGLAIFFFLRNKKKKQAVAPTTPAGTTPPAYQAPPMQQQQHPGPNGYNAVPQGQTGYYDPKNPYPSPGAQYNTPVTGFYQPGTPDPNQQHDPRLSQANTSPSPSYNPQGVVPQQGFQPQQTVIHEAPTDNHGRNETHELA